MQNFFFLIYKKHFMMFLYFEDFSKDLRKCVWFISSPLVFWFTIHPLSVLMEFTCGFQYLLLGFKSGPIQSWLFWLRITLHKFSLDLCLWTSIALKNPFLELLWMLHLPLFLDKYYPSFQNNWISHNSWSNMN